MTPLLQLIEWAASQASPWDGHNAALRALEWFAAGGAVEDRDVLDPTALTPSDGEAWLIDGTGAGAWVGHDGKIALFVNSGWVWFDPLEGMSLFVKDEDLRIVWDGAAWADLQLASYTVATLPAATPAGRMIYVSDESGGAVPAFSDGSDWRRVTDRAVVS